MATIRKTTKYVLALPHLKAATQIGKPPIQTYVLKEIEGAALQELLSTNDPKLNGALVIETQNIHYVSLKQISVLELDETPPVAKAGD